MAPCLLIHADRTQADMPTRLCCVPEASDEPLEVPGAYSLCLLVRQLTLVPNSLEERLGRFANKAPGFSSPSFLWFPVPPPESAEGAV